MRPPAFYILSTLALASPLPALAQPEPPPDRVFNLIVYGDDPCPASADDNEIVVCARRPEAERYRIPKKLREKPEAIGGPGWGSQVATMENIQRQTLPGSCSAIGSNGFSGCTAKMLEQWFAERRMREQAEQP
ncbi:hypothetical protein WG908_12390 [Sphingobium sp. AN641]|uniref:hypothetical protein n=1 Tax=Sphingobium sp. AN641 TaxID=3133443 RepID=UPI0030C59FE1